MDNESPDEIIERILKNFREIIESLDSRITKVTQGILTLNEQDEKLLMLIAGLHKIDLDALREEIRVEDK